MSLPPEPIGQAVSTWGEGPIWFRDTLWYVDIEGRRVRTYRPADGRECSWKTGQRTGFVVPRRVGGLVCGGDHGFFFLDPGSGRTEPIADPEADKPDNRFNDGKCSPDGRLFAGTISLARKTGDARLYRLDPDLSFGEAFGPVTNSNGIGWSPDGTTCYYIDTPSKEVKAFDYDPGTGTLTNGRTAFATDPEDGSPDGLAMDADHRLWIAFCHGGKVRCFRHDGTVVETIEVPALETTAVAFGGRDLTDLYITTGIHKEKEEPLAGRLFVLRGLPTPGLAANPFAG